MKRLNLHILFQSLLQNLFLVQLDTQETETNEKRCRMQEISNLDLEPLGLEVLSEHLLVLLSDSKLHRKEDNTTSWKSCRFEN